MSVESCVFFSASKRAFLPPQQQENKRFIEQKMAITPTCFATLRTIDRFIFSSICVHCVICVSLRCVNCVPFCLFLLLYVFIAYFHALFLLWTFHCYFLLPLRTLLNGVFLCLLSRFPHKQLIILQVLLSLPLTTPFNPYNINHQWVQWVWSR